MKKFRTVLAVGAGLFVSLNLFNATSTLAFTPDELSVIAAVEQTTPTPAADVPADGNFYSAKNLDGPPLPGNVGYPAWNLGFGTWLVDDLTSVSTTKSMSRMSVGSLAPEFSGLSVPDTNGLWLEITNYDGNYAYLNLMNGTDFVYCVKSATDLTVPFSAWQVEGEMFPTNDQTNCLPFTVATLGRTNLFLRAMDWNGIDSDGDGVPDWWSWLYWATNNLPDTSLDYSGDGNTFAQDYSNNIVPTVFSFTGLEVTNNYANSMSVPVQLDVSGNPCNVAITVDDTNYASDAAWEDYSGSDVTVNLGLTEGWHDVWIGLRGHGDDPANAVWQWSRLKLDLTPPQLVITSPTNGTVDASMIQLTGYSPEAVDSISYDLSNAVAVATNQQMVKGSIVLCYCH